MQLIDGKLVSEKILSEVTEEVKALFHKGITPTLAVVLVGDDPASAIYVRNKERACEKVGIRSVAHRLPADIPEEELLALLHDLNQQKEVHAILLQLPLPKHLNSERLLAAISADKDADGFHEENMGKLVLQKEGLLPCTPAGVMELLRHYQIEIAGKECVVVGRSNIVGKPMSLMLLNANGTVTTCHSKTKNLQEICQRADILVAAVGRPQMITSDYIKEGAVVIDVGIHRMENGKLCGDVLDTEGKAAYLTPVPGGVGPMTIAMLMKNCVKAAQKSIEQKKTVGKLSQENKVG